MKYPVTSDKPRKRFSLLNLSIQKRLPLLICLLLLVIIIFFTWTAYVAVKDSALQTGRERLHTLTEQLSTMFAQSAQSLIAGTKAVANREEIRKSLAEPGLPTDSISVKLMEKLRTDSTTILIELLDTKFTAVLKSEQPGTSINIARDSVIALPALAHDSATVGKMYLLRDTIYYPTMAMVALKGKLLGYLINWKLVRATPQAIEQVSGLIGTQGKLLFANTDGKLWTNLVNEVPAPPTPPVGAQPGKVLEYKDRGGSPVMSAIRPVPSTSWLLMVEFSKQKVLETANRFLYTLLIIGMILIAAGILVAWSMSRNITRPLKKLTAAATAMTEGDYSKTVAADRQDELGKLAEAFNTMAAQVRSAQYDLEEKVQERTIELERVKEAAERANQSKTRFLSSMSHEIRTPLNGILGFTEILRNKSLGEKERLEYLSHIKTAGELLSKLIGDILDLSKIEEGKLVLENESFHFKEFIESSMYPYKFQVNENGIDFVMEINDSIPDYLISDRLRIHQLLVNLIGNSIKFTKEGQIGIKISGEKKDDENFILKMSVYDTGIGIPPDKFDKIFENFTQANETIGRNYGGSGLGLAIVRQLVTAMNGRINVVSPFPHKHPKGNVGSCFEIELPVKIDVARKQFSSGEFFLPDSSLKEKNISVLVVDDNIMNQKLASFLLEKLGCRVQVAGDGQEALDLASTNKFNVILMDVHMPIMDGYEASIIMRKQMHLDTPIIGVTANVFKDDIEKCLQAGMNDHLGKPYVESQLAGKINKWIMASVENV